MLYTSSLEDHWLVFCQGGEGCYAYLHPGTVRGSASPAESTATA
jgi:hypothetical protein